jgi:hypothetical protein
VSAFTKREEKALVRTEHDHFKKGKPWKGNQWSKQANATYHKKNDNDFLCQNTHLDQFATRK